LRTIAALRRFREVVLHSALLNVPTALEFLRAK